MDLNALNSSEVKGILTLFARNIACELSNWADAQRELGLTECPKDDPRWGELNLNAPPTPVTPVRVPAPSRIPQTQSTPKPQAAAASSRSSVELFKAMQQSRSTQAFSSPEEKRTALEMQKSQCSACRNCPLGPRRRDILWGYGPSDASIMFVSAGGNPAELDQNRLMTGECAVLLDNIIRAMAQINPEASQERIYMTNVIKCACIPAKGTALESARKCIGFLRREVQIIKPRIIIVWGETAYRAMFGGDALISQVRGTIMKFEGIPTICTHHPYEMCKNPSLKGRVWSDLQQALAQLR